MLAESLERVGWGPRWEGLLAGAPQPAGAEPARVVRHDGVAVELLTASGPASADLTTAIEPHPVVGDWVVVADGAVVSVLPRASALRRRDPGEDVEQVLVANVDVVLVVCGLDRPVKAGRIARAIATARDAGANPLVVLTKSDLHDDPPAMAGAVEAANPGVAVVVTSATTGAGVEAVRAAVAGRTAVLLGESGAGKSTLTNALLGDDVAAIGEVRSSDAKGRHTTTTRNLHVLPAGGALIDTPGVRALGLWVDPEAVAAAFPDVEDLAAGCRFNDCAHDGEPGCAVAAAVDSGDVTPERLASYLELRAEADAAQARPRRRR